MTGGGGYGDTELEFNNVRVINPYFKKKGCAFRVVGQINLTLMIERGICSPFSNEKPMTHDVVLWPSGFERRTAKG